MLVDMLLDVNIPKKVKKMNSGRRVLHIGDIDTCMDDEDILHIAGKFGCLIVTHDRSLALRAAKKYRALFIKEPIAAEDIIFCLEKNKELLKTASIFCDGNKCQNCNNITFLGSPLRREGP
ncbi:MAG: hypothetical protein QME59_02195 [Candidatus Hydrothermarchaeota archaeon]|nr:hypothetical protein [Candidatus Hydrothermarchaeota archaeon]